MAWTPGKMLFEKTYEPAGAGGPYQYVLEPQDHPYSLDIWWGGRSKSDTGAKGGAYLYSRDMDNDNASDVEIAYERTRREFPDDASKAEDWVVTGYRRGELISAKKKIRITCIWAVGNEHCVNVALKIRFNGYVRTEDGGSIWKPIVEG